MPSDPNSPFAAAMTQAQTVAKNAADEFSRMFATMKLPALPDSEALLTAHKRNMETLTAANRVAMEGAQAVAKRHMEIMQQTMAELSESMRAMSGGGNPQAKAANQAEMLKHAYERAVANAKELGDLIQHANGEALALLNHRFVEAMDEVKGLMAKGGAEAK